MRFGEATGARGRTRITLAGKPKKLVYCLANYKKHQRVTSGAPRIDPCSSARWFQGWTAIRTHDDGERPSEEARTVPLRSAWTKHGFIHPGERPHAPG